MPASRYASRSRNREAECLCGLQIDYQLQLRGLLNRKIGGLLAVENSANVDAGQPVRIRKACSVANQAAVNSELAGKVDCWQSVAERQRGELFAPADEEWVGDNKERAGPQVGYHRQPASGGSIPQLPL